MKNRVLYVLITSLVICATFTGVLTIKSINDAPLTTEPSLNSPINIAYNDNTPDFSYKELKETEFLSRDDVYKEYFELNRQFDEFIDKYKDGWSDSKLNKNYEIFQECLIPLNNLLEDKFYEKSDSDVLSEKKYLIETKLSNLSDAYIFDRESESMCSDETKKEFYRNSANEKEEKYFEAMKYYKGFNEGKHTIDDVLQFMGIKYDEYDNPLFIPPEYHY